MRAPYRERRLGVARWRGNGRFGHVGWPETSDEGPLDYGRLRRHRPPLRLELDSGKAGDDNPGDCYPRGKCDPHPPHLLPTRLPAPRDGRVLEHPLARSVFIPRKELRQPARPGVSPYSMACAYSKWQLALLVNPERLQ